MGRAGDWGSKWAADGVEGKEVGFAPTNVFRGLKEDF